MHPVMSPAGDCGNHIIIIIDYFIIMIIRINPIGLILTLDMLLT